MEREQPESGKRNEDAGTSASSDGRQAWEEPKLAFVEPKLAKHGKLDQITRDPNGFFGQFSP